MKEETHIKEKKIALLERELATITECLEEVRAALKDAEELRREVKGLKLFIGRVHPEFKVQFPGIMKKIKG